MAERLRKFHQDEVRTKIQTSQLINRLTSYALGTPESEEKIAELTTGQLKAIEILLRKSLPDLSAVQVSGDEDNPLEVVTRIELVDGDGES